MKNLTIVALLVLSGCNAVGWGATHRVVFANEEAVTIHYDPFVGGLDAAMAEAAAQCGRYKRNAVPTMNYPQGGGSSTFVQVYRCV